MTYIVAVAAPVGGGKTSLVHAIARELGDASTIHFDTYEKATSRPVHELRRWLEEGADIDAFILPELSRDLERLKRGLSVVESGTGREIAPRKYLVFEMPLGKEHRDTAAQIDLLVWIDLPLDIALARKLKEFTGRFLAKYGAEKQRDCMVWLDGYLENYLSVVRDAMEMQQQRVPRHADVILDGRQDFETIVQRATSAIRARRP
jgi:uridine kinase